MLNQYAEIFNSVEGNTSFYADPSRDTLLRWRAQVNDDFRFTFKIPQRISHQSGLLNYQTDLTHWLTLFEPILEQTGNIMLQLPSTFSPEMLARLDSFIRAWPSALPLSVEVRNLGFFQKDDSEKRFNQLLIEHQVDRIMMDTRALFSEAPTNAAIIDAQQKKPKVPLHVIATGNKPMIRFVGCSTLENNRPFYAPWLAKIKAWLAEGKSPYVFFHTADNHESAFLARQFMLDLGLTHPVLLPFPGEREAQQSSLF